MPPIDRFGAAELRRMIVVYVVLVTRIVGALAAGSCAGPRRGLWSAASHGAVDGFERLGPTYVKLGQIIASSPGLFPAPWRKPPSVASTRFPLLTARRPATMIRQDLGRQPAAIFKRFDDVPLSAASIGQVHACVLPDGREAVIKLQRPNIRRRMTTDLRIMYRLAKTLERHLTFARNANAVALVEDFHVVTFNELNPALEALAAAPVPGEDRGVR